jgi:methylmalonyl-CoA mutase cobalamin-binding subunit
MTTATVARPRKRSLVVLAGRGHVDERGAHALMKSLGHVGIEAIYLAPESSPRRIATAAVAEQADAIELCIATHGGGGSILRELLRELDRLDRRQVRIVVHRMN